MLFGKLDPLAFALALGLGLMVVYATAPRPKRVVRFPSPLNVGTTVYRDEKKGCYVYTADKVPCTDDALTPPAQDDGGAPG